MKKFLLAIIVALGIGFVAKTMINQEAQAPTTEDAVAAGLSGFAAIWAEIMAFFSSIFAGGAGIAMFLAIAAISIFSLWLLGMLFSAIFGGIDIDFDM